MEWNNRLVWLPSPDDVIVVKLRWLAGLRRNKDFDDSLQVATIRRDTLDWSYLERWCDAHGTREILAEIRAKACAD